MSPKEDAMNSDFQYPTPEQIERHMEAARRMRSETVHGLLKAAGTWFTGARRTRTPQRGTVIVGKTARA
jgi:hypothetical protein